MAKKSKDGYYKAPRELMRKIIAECNPKLSLVASYLNERARYSFDDSKDGLKRGQLKTSTHKIAKETKINQSKVVRIMRFLKEIGFVNCEEIRSAGGQHTGTVFMLPFYDTGEKLKIEVTG